MKKIVNIKYNNLKLAQLNVQDFIIFYYGLTQDI